MLPLTRCCPSHDAATPLRHCPPVASYPPGGLVTELDPDAPSRQARPLHPDNAKAEDRLAYRLWQLVRSGACSSDCAEGFAPTPLAPGCLCSHTLIRSLRTFTHAHSQEAMTALAHGCGWRARTPARVCVCVCVDRRMCAWSPARAQAQQEATSAHLHSVLLACLQGV